MAARLGHAVRGSPSRAPHSPTRGLDWADGEAQSAANQQGQTPGAQGSSRQVQQAEAAPLERYEQQVPPELLAESLEVSARRDVTIDHFRPLDQSAEQDSQGGQGGERYELNRQVQNLEQRPQTTSYVRLSDSASVPRIAGWEEQAGAANLLSRSLSSASYKGLTGSRYSYIRIPAVNSARSLCCSSISNFSSSAVSIGLSGGTAGIGRGFKSSTGRYSSQLGLGRRPATAADVLRTE